MDRSRQMEELDSLKSIYYNEEFQVLENSSQDDKIQAIFWAFFTLPDNYKVKFLKSLDSPEPSWMKVKHLPPIELMLTLPRDYPTKAPPEFVISCKWLQKSNITSLCKKLDEMWLECGPAEILYSWCDFLKNDSLSFLGCDKQLDLTYLCLMHLKWRERNNFRVNACRHRPSEKSGGSKGVEAGPVEAGSGVNIKLDNAKGLREGQNGFQQRHSYFKTNYKVKKKHWSAKRGGNRFDERVVLNLSLKMSPLKVLENYNNERERVEFLKSAYTCKICFSDKLGKDCIEFKDCKHVFCTNCIRSYFTIRIRDGTVQSIKCPEEKCTSEATPCQVKEIVSEELFAKYDSVLLRTALDTLGDIIYCPRQICQYPVSWEPEDKMASCPNCRYVFCVTCKMVYHGVEPCQFKAGEAQKLVQEYENGTPEVRQQLEARFGKKRLEVLVNNSKAEAWIEENSKACPKCGAAIEKSQGCNKMVCWKCNSPFCWLCCEILDSKDPYSHFSNPQSQCANKLFHLVPDFEEEEEDDWDWGYDSDEEEYIHLFEDEPF